MKIYMLRFIRLIRYEQWVKNFFIFLPAFFNGILLSKGIFLNLIVSFISFSLVCSSVYILNDYFDIEKDRMHPTKRLRPLAAGEISITQAFIGMIILLIGGMTLAAFNNIILLWLSMAYFLMNVAYTLKLKNIAILDVNIIALGFIIRILYGGVTSGVVISKWLWIITYLLTLVLAFGKRRDEITIYLKSGQKLRKSIDGYNLEFINASMICIVVVLLVSYIMYTVSSEVTIRLNSEYIYFTSFFVVLGMLRFLQQALVFNVTGSPTQLLLKDRFLQLILLGWVMMFGYFIYGSQIIFNAFH